MSKYSTENIRNIALVGHTGAGKTTLVEALLSQSGALTQMGSIEKGSTTTDFEDEEKRLQHSINSSIVRIEHAKCEINLLDTPGYSDFIGQTLSVLPAVDTVAIVINARSGIEFMARRLMRWATRHGYCRLIIVNRIDGAEKKLEKLLDQIRETFGKECLPVNLPGKDPNKVVDCFFHEQGEPAFSSVAEVHTALVDQIVEVDETIMEEYLESGNVEPGKLHEPFEKALREGHIIPVCFCSAQTGTGVAELLDIFHRLMPNPLEGTPHPFTDEDTHRSILPIMDQNKHVIAHVFKILHDPFIGKLGIFRIHQGKVTSDTQLFIGEQRKPFKVSHLFRIHGKEHFEVQVGIPGDICAVAKVDELAYDAVLHNSHDEDHIHALDLDFPIPMMGLAINPKNHGDEQKLSEAIDKLIAEDPCLNIEQNSHTHETILRGMGDLHLRVVQEKLEGRYNVAIESSKPSIAYREAVTNNAEGHFKHKKQSGGSGQFGEVYLRIEPKPRGKGFEFVNAVVGGAIPGQYIPGVEKGVRQALQEGSIAGFPFQDIRVTVYDGKHHSVDSNEISFVTAGRKAFLNAVKNANPILLEPVMDLEVTVPQTKMGDISSDLASRRGQITNTQNSNENIIINAHVPLAELDDYQSKLKSLTGGEGMFTMELGTYQTTPANIQKQLIQEYKSKRAG